MLQARRGLVVAAALSFALASFAPPPALAAAADPVLLERAAAEREVYGLATDMTTMLRLFAGADVGTAKWGIPLTEEEEQALDLDARMTFVDELNDKLLPYARSLPTFAGAWVDQLHEGGVVMALTEMDPVTVQAVTDLLPPDSRGLEFQSASNSYQTLKRKVDEAREAMSLVAPDVKITSVSIDTTRNGVRIKISKASSEGGIAAAPVVEQRVGVPIFLEEELIADDVSCTTRDSCFSPLKAGVRIRQGSTTSGSICTMGFHIRVGSDEQFLTAGHCGYSGSNSWYHTGYGLVGSEIATLYSSGGKDVMRVGLPDAQASNLIYGTSHTGTLGSGALPVVNETVCASEGNNNAIDCGTVSDDWTSWTSTTANYVVYGGDTDGIYPIGGDSGSPLFTRRTVGDDIVIQPKGIVDTSAGMFARVVDALSAWNAAIVQ